MGFVRKRKLYELDFTGTSLEGLTMVMRGLSVQEALDLSALQELEKAPFAEQKERLGELFEFVASRIENWNLQDEAGNPIEPTAAELLTWDAGEAFAAIGAWQDAVQDVPAPLERPSSGGRSLGAVSIPMDIPLPNLPPSPMPN